MKSLNIIRDSTDKLYKRKKDTYCVYKKCKNYKLRNKNLCRPHERKIVNQRTQEYIKIIVTTVFILLSIYFMYNFDVVGYLTNFDFKYLSNFDFKYLSNFDGGFKYVGENIKKMTEYSMYVFSNVDMYIYNIYSNVNMCSVLTDVQDESFVTENTICYILKDIQNKLFEYIKY
jgi:hypothetical protein